MNLKRMFFWFLPFLVISIFLTTFYNFSSADNIDGTYSNGTGTNIGAWYDELWEASCFYTLQLDASSTDSQINLRYVRTCDRFVLQNSTLTFVRENTVEIKNTTIAAHHTHGYNDTTPGASMPQDIVVTEWKVTGHVHFNSNL